MSDADRARALRRRHMHERQAVIFGVLLAVLAVVGLGAAAIYTGSLSLPFVEQDFQAKPSPTATSRPFPCPPTGALPVAYGDITVNVYNSTTQAGLAATTMKAFTDRGFVAGETGNQPPFDGTTQVSFGPTGIAAAYTVAAHLTDPMLVLDGRPNATVDVTIGAAFTDLVASDAVTLDPETPLEGLKGCTPYTAASAPATTPTATATS